MIIPKLVAYATFALLSGCAARGFEAYTKNDRSFEQNGVHCNVKTLPYNEQVQVTQQEDVPFLVRGWHNKTTGKVDIFEYRGINSRAKAESLLRKCTADSN